MAKFVLHSLAWITCVLALHFVAARNMDGRADTFYLRFTQENLILGTSRAAQGLRPAVIKECLGIDVYNYAFTTRHSPYGDTYLNSIRKKVKRGSKQGLFVVTVDPWSISSMTSDPNDSVNFREIEQCVGTTTSVTSEPNFQYLLTSFQGRYYDTLCPRGRGMLLHTDGWLEISLDMALSHATARGKSSRASKGFKL